MYIYGEAMTVAVDMARDSEGEQLRNERAIKYSVELLESSYYYADGWRRVVDGRVENGTEVRRSVKRMIDKAMKHAGARRTRHNIDAIRSKVRQAMEKRP